MTEAEAVKGRKNAPPIFLTLCVTGAIALSACDKKSAQDVDRAFQDVNVIDEAT